MDFMQGIQDISKIELYQGVKIILLLKVPTKSNIICVCSFFSLVKHNLNSTMKRVDIVISS